MTSVGDHLSVSVTTTGALLFDPAIPPPGCVPIHMQGHALQHGTNSKRVETTQISILRGLVEKVLAVPLCGGGLCGYRKATDALSEFPENFSNKSKVRAVCTSCDLSWGREYICICLCINKLTRR